MRTCLRRLTINSYWVPEASREQRKEKDQSCVKFLSLQRLGNHWEESRSEPKGLNPQDPRRDSHVLQGVLTSVLIRSDEIPAWLWGDLGDKILVDKIH